LELGCGTGRILSKLSDNSTLCVGIDNDFSKLLIARPKLSPISDLLLKADIGCYTLNQKFDRIIIPYNTLCALGSDIEVENCLRNAGHHLSQCGFLYLDIYTVHASYLKTRATMQPLEEEEHLCSFELSNLFISVFHKESILDSSRNMTIYYRYEIREQDSSELQEVIHDEIKHHIIPKDVLDNLIIGAGLTQVDIWGGVWQKVLRQS